MDSSTYSYEPMVHGTRAAVVRGDGERERG